MNSPHPRSAADRYWILGLAVGLPLLAMSTLGLDSNWDLRNYHLYNPHAWLSGRDAIDIAPAQLQSWHNPLLDLPLYLIVSAGLPARWASAWLTLPYIVALYCLLRLQALLGPSPPSRIAQIVLALMALTGAATYSTLGLSMNDGFVAAAMLGSLLLLLRAQADGDTLRPWLVAGLLAGAMTGLKLTAGLYCVALAGAVLAAGPWPRSLPRLVRLALGGIIGFGLSYGYWGWQQFVVHGNPLFPYFNQVFHSPDALAVAYADVRFRPASLAEGLLAPLQLLHRSRKFSELMLSDPRLLLGLLSFGALILLYRKQFPAEATLRARLRAVLAFFVISFLLWIMQYGIYRYAIVIELLSCLALVLLLQRLPRAANIALPLVLLLVSAGTKRPNWGHDAVALPRPAVLPAPISADALVLTADGEPLAYLALGLPDSVPLVAVSNNLLSPQRCSRLQSRAEGLIASHRGPIWLLQAAGAGGGIAQRTLSEYYGLRSDGACIAWPNALAAAHLCPQARQSAPRPPRCPPAAGGR